MKKIALAVLAILLVGCSSGSAANQNKAKAALGLTPTTKAATVVGKWPVYKNPPANCAELMVRDIATNNYKGLMGCMSDHFKYNLFQKGITTDERFQQYENTQIGGATVQPKGYEAYPGNPVGNTFSYRLESVNADDSLDWEKGSTINITLDDQGKIDNIG